MDLHVLDILRFVKVLNQLLNFLFIFTIHFPRCNLWRGSSDIPHNMSELLHLRRLSPFVGGFASNLIGGRVAEVDADVDADADINADADDNMMLMAPFGNTW